MTEFPSALRIQVVPALRSDVPVRQLLVGLNIRHRGRTYYGTILGLTDEHGALEVTGHMLRDDYCDSQHDFPMDYKLAIAECDPEAIVGLGGGREFEAHRSLALQSPLVREPFRSWWAVAQNNGVAATETAIVLNGTVVEAQLFARRVGVPW